VPDSVNFDFSELTELAADLDQVRLRGDAHTGTRLRQAVEITARNVRDAWRAKLEGSEHVPAGPYSVTYDMGAGESLVHDVLTGTSGTAASITAEIGPEIDRAAGALVGMLEFGTPTVAPTGYGHASLQENEADFQAGIAKAIEEST
jgi:hypothetical protein